VAEPTTPQDQVTAFWSMVAAGYEAHPGNVPSRGSALYARWVQVLDQELGSAPRKVLDLATGTGFVALILAELGHSVTAIDISAEMLAEARKTAGLRSDVRFELGDAVEPAMPAGSFDTVVNRHLLWTLREPAGAMSRWRDLLCPNGVLLCFDGFWFGSAPSEEEPEPFRRHYTTSTRSALPFMDSTSPEPIIAAMEEAGFAHVTWRSLPELTDDATGTPPYLVRAVK
jgi:ubiquinone/menaquinone biosynthesis C-methylase UbiE